MILGVSRTLLFVFITENILGKYIGEQGWRSDQHILASRQCGPGSMPARFRMWVDSAAGSCITPSIANRGKWL